MPVQIRQPQPSGSRRSQGGQFDSGDSTPVAFTRCATVSTRRWRMRMCPKGFSAGSSGTSPRLRVPDTPTTSLGRSTGLTLTLLVRGDCDRFGSGRSSDAWILRMPVGICLNPVWHPVSEPIGFSNPSSPLCCFPALLRAGVGRPSLFYQYRRVCGLRGIGSRFFGQALRRI